ncbi:hypothetical protein Tco_1228653 [Tanacetum coccineum]
MPKYMIKSIDKAALKEYDLKSALYQTMHENKSFNRNPANHALYHALMEALIEDENAMDKGVADTGKKIKRRRTKESESSKNPSTTKETSKGKASAKSSKNVNNVGEDVVCDDDQPQDTSEPKIYKTLNQDWFKQPQRPPTPDPEWNKCQVILDQPEQPWFNQMVFATKDPLTFNDLMATLIDFSNRPDHLTVVVDYFFNNDLEYLKTSNLEKTYTTSITKTKAARSQMNKFSKHNVYSTQKILGMKSVSIKKLHGYGHLEVVVLFHLNDTDIVDFIMALRMFTRSLIIKRQVEDLQLGVESYQKKLNITTPQQTFLEIEFKELYSPSYKPPGDELHHIILDFHLGYNDEMSRRKWMAIDKKRSKLMVELIDKQMRERRIIGNLERLVGAQELKMDYKLMTCINIRVMPKSIHSDDGNPSRANIKQALCREEVTYLFTLTVLSALRRSGVKSFNTEHKLNEYKHTEPVKPKKRGLAPKQNEAACKDVDELMKARILREVKYQM